MLLTIEPKTPYQLWYICDVYPENVTPEEAKTEYEREYKTPKDYYWESIYKIIYGKEWIDN